VVEDVPAAFAELVAGQAASAGAGGDLFRLVLSGGETARACYERLAVEDGLDWSRIEVLVGDERCVPAQDADANQHMIREALVDRVEPRPAFTPMNCGDPLETYERVISSSARLDLVHLGLGPDGHTASLFPGSEALDAPPGQLVARNVDPTGRNRHPRLTLTLAGIARARLAVFTVAGTDKHEALRALGRGEDLPAARVRAGRVVWLCDPGAVGSGPAGLG
jgi:6-phosphogluconolactonase